MKEVLISINTDHSAVTSCLTTFGVRFRYYRKIFPFPVRPPKHSNLGHK